MPLKSEKNPSKTASLTLQHYLLLGFSSYQLICLYGFIGRYNSLYSADLRLLLCAVTPFQRVFVVWGTGALLLDVKL